MFTPITTAPRVVTVPVATSAPVKLALDPFLPGNVVAATSVGAGRLSGACHPGINSSTRYFKFKVTSASANQTVTIPAAGEAVPAMTTAVDTPAEQLAGIVMVNGTVYARGDDSDSSPSAGVWVRGASDGRVIKLTASASLPVGTEIEVLVPGTVDTVGAALTANVPAERKLVTDTTKAAVDFVSAVTAAVTLFKNGGC
jgi:hypothetical protein